MSDLTSAARPRASRLLSGAAMALLIRLGSAGLSFASMVAISRWLGATSYGEFAFMLTLGSFMGLAATLGLPTLALRAIPQISAAGGAYLSTATPRFVRRTCTAILGAGALICLVMALVSFGLGNPLILWAGCLVLPFAYAEHLSHVLRSLGSITTALVYRDILWYALTTALAALAGGLLPSFGPVWLPSPIPAFVAISALLLGLIVIQGRSLLLALRRWPAPNVETAADAAGQYRIGWRSEALFLWLSTMSGAVQRHLSVVVTAPFLTATETGAFFAAHRTALLLSLPLIAANLVAAPLIARAWAEKSPQRVQRLCKLIVLGASVPALLGLVVISFAGNFLLSLFHPDFVIALGALYVFAISSLINALCGPTGGLMLMTGHEKLFVAIQISTQIVSLGLTMIGAAYWGIMGAAIGASLGTASWNILVWLWCRRNIGIDPTLFAWVSTPQTPKAS
ncbi:lipopolysaccharide biosynthesis protein [Salipiger sp. PrR002]|uniref:lipopolysaccharide biosynthesis protein n=1 Tax=Salipiger sp. PrR002 TaxID=2706489 RepID=UPI0013BDFAE8|nr:lipopolysaccharide biosynthesis protein [Salipiger sp. PrR002]NDW00440.1 lipopolysaccharide biosynthesis protein [Salipiger sp. PrR002]NDW56398.1 lipopolysaccharide biosynthesis protein [Salipiger sp. PrR004]